MLHALASISIAAFLVLRQVIRVAFKIGLSGCARWVELHCHGGFGSGRWAGEAVVELTPLSSTMHDALSEPSFPASTLSFEWK